MKLLKFLKSNDIKKSSFAIKLGVSTTAVDHWVNERRFPRIKFIKKIEQLTRGKVTANDLYDTKKKRFFNLF